MADVKASADSAEPGEPREPRPPREPRAESSRGATGRDGSGRPTKRANAKRAAGRSKPAREVPLFRPEVLGEKKNAWLGTVLLVPTIPHKVFVAFALGSILALVALLGFAEYPRRAHVAGWLVPDRGLVRVFSPQPGVLTETFVKEGDSVKKGDRLVALSAEVQSKAFGGTQAEVAKHLQDRLRSLRLQRDTLEQLAEQQRQSLAERTAALEAAKGSIEGEMAYQGALLASANKSVARAQALEDAGLASGTQTQSAQEGVLAQGARLRELERSRQTAEQDRLLMEGNLKGAPLRSQADLANVDQTIAQVEEELAEVEARREMVIPAPETGVVTAMQAERGARSDGKTPLLSVVPEHSTLEARIYCPSTAVGFLRVGQRVLLRYHAFPYQKFGHHQGTITSISQSAISPSELPAEAVGLVAPTGTGAAGEALYRVTVRLADASVTAYGRAINLQPGMQFEADVILEQRRLYEWMLEPLYTLTGRMHP